MPTFDPSKLRTTFLPPATIDYPLQGRRYTLTHSDQTGNLFLDIGYQYNVKSIDPTKRDEVLAEWLQTSSGLFALVGQVHVSSGEFNETNSGIRFQIFQKEMPLALQAILYGDRLLYDKYPFLLDAQIYIYYRSSFPAYNVILHYGTVRQHIGQ